MFHKHRIYFHKIKREKGIRLETKVWFSQITFPAVSRTLSCLPLVRQGHEKKSLSFHDFDSLYTKSDITISSL